MKKLTLLALGGAMFGVAAHGQFVPVALTPDSYNHDLIVETNALKQRPVGATTATIDAGAGNTAATVYEQGYNPDAPLTGLPPAGSTFSSAILPDHSFTLAGSYSANNALILDTNITTGTLSLASATPLAALSFLTTAGNGSPTIGYTVHHADGSTDVGTFVAPDWYSSPDSALLLNGRVNVVSGVLESVDSGNPHLYSVDVNLTSASPVTRIELQAMQTNNAHAAIFAVSGASTAGGPFAPLAVAGFNHDVVVEANAYRPPATLGATTASMDSGALNTAFSWYEMGYNSNTNGTNTGLPRAGMTFTNVSAQDHTYSLAASYAGNNAALVDSENTGRFTLASPRSYSALSFLASAGHGPASIAATITHADGSVQTTSISVLDWYGGANPAWIANGRVNVASGALDSVGGNNPRLYSIDVPLDNKTSPVTSVDFAFESGAADAHTAFFALSGATGAGAPTVVTHPSAVTVSAGADAQLSVTATGTQPLTYQWQRLVNGTWVNVQNGTGVSGATSATLSFTGTTFDNQGQYRVLVSNPSGSTTSFEGNLTVLSTAQDVTASTDVVELVGGSAPENEPASAAIDDTTSKYLNFGIGDAAVPFEGPVGLVVTPTLGSSGSGTIVNAVRVYAANDAVDRDPVTFTLEGSQDGTSFTLITSNSFSLSATRNVAGEALSPLTQSVSEVRFNNSMPYKSYRLLFHTVKNGTAANSMQIGEVELLGTESTGSVAVLSATRTSPTSMTITTSQPGTLQSATELRSSGTTWTSEGPISGSTTVNTTGRMKFYRVLVQ